MIRILSALLILSSAIRFCLGGEAAATPRLERAGEVSALNAGLALLVDLDPPFEPPALPPFPGLAISSPNLSEVFSGRIPICF